MNIKAMKQALEALDAVIGLIKHQYTGSREAMSALQIASDNAFDAAKEMRKALQEKSSIDYTTIYMCGYYDGKNSKSVNKKEKQ